jgi:hypothetical protein
MFGGPEVSYHQTHSARDWLSILRTPYTTQDLQRKRRTVEELYRPKTLPFVKPTALLMNITYLPQTLPPKKISLC